jgi:hypothetical protein
MSQNMSFGSNGVERVRSLWKIPTQLRLVNLAHVRPVLKKKLSWSNETFPNAPKQEFWVEWIGSGAFVAKNSNVTSFSKLVR